MTWGGGEEVEVGVLGLRTPKGLEVEVGRWKRKEGREGAEDGVEDGGTGGGAEEEVEVGGTGGA